MLDSNEARMLIARVIHNDKTDLSRLKQIMGNALRGFFGANVPA
jgi:hypothetical protein